MKALLLLALRNIFKNKRRTAMTFMAIISGMTGIIVFGGFIEFTYQGLRETTIRTQLGHVQIYKKGYSEQGIADPSHYLMDNPEQIETMMSGMPNIKMITRRLTFSGLVSTGEKTLTCKGIGIVVAKKEEEMSNFETIVDGVQLEPDMRDGGVVGIDLMNALGAKVGDNLTLLTTTRDGTINGIDFKIVGVAQTGSQEYDSVFIKLPIQSVQKLLDTTSIEKMIVLLDETDNVSKVMPLLENIIKEKGLDLELKSWSELAAFYHKVVKLYDGIFDVVRIIIAIIVLFSVANTMSMSVFERVREIGTLRAIGTTRGGILRLFMAEGFLIGVLGGLLGIIMSILIAYAINISGGIEIPPPPSMNRGYTALILIIPKVIFHAFLLIVSVSTLSSLYPAYKASQLKVVEALQHV